MAKTTKAGSRVKHKTQTTAERKAANLKHSANSRRKKTEAVCALLRKNADLEVQLLIMESKLDAARILNTINLTLVDGLQQQNYELQTEAYERLVETRPYTSQHMAAPTQWFDTMAGNGVH